MVFFMTGCQAYWEELPLCKGRELMESVLNRQLCGPVIGCHWASFTVLSTSQASMPTTYSADNIASGEIELWPDTNK